MMIRNRADARWLPTRFNTALARLIAFTVCRARQPRHQPGLVLAIDRNQSATENYFVAIWFYLSSVAYFFSGLERLMPRWSALLVALPATALTIQFLTHLFSFGTHAWRQQSHARLNSVALMLIMIFLSFSAITTTHWTRFVGGMALLLFAMNAIAAVAVRMLGSRFAALERSFEAEV